MSMIRRRLYSLFRDLADRFADLPLGYDDTEKKLWSISLFFTGTEREAQMIVETLGDVACGNPRCGEYGEGCSRGWMATAVLAPEPEENL